MNATNGRHHVTPLNVFVEEAQAHGSEEESPPRQIAIQLRVRLEQDPPPAVHPVDVGGLRSLSGRERVLIELLVQGRTDEAIARELGLSKRTVSYGVSALMRRLGARNRFQLGWMLGNDVADPS